MGSKSRVFRVTTVRSCTRAVAFVVERKQGAHARAGLDKLFIFADAHQHQRWLAAICDENRAIRRFAFGAGGVLVEFAAGKGAGFFTANDALLARRLGDKANLLHTGLLRSSHGLGDALVANGFVASDVEFGLGRLRGSGFQ
jgi:hypothetical protein